MSRLRLIPFLVLLSGLAAASPVYAQETFPLAWRVLIDPEKGYPAYSITETQAGLVVGTTGGLLVSPDSGATWNHLEIDEPGAARVVDLRVGQDGSWWTITDRDVLVSVDAGASWSVRSPGDFPYTHLLVTRPGTVVAYSPGLLHSTLDGGTTWTTIEAPRKLNYLVHVQAGLILAGNDAHGLEGTGGDLWASTDGGQSWSDWSERINYSGTTSAVGVSDGRILLGNAFFGYLESLDGGLSFGQRSENEKGEVGRQFGRAAHGTLFSFGDFGIYRSEDNADTWSRVLDDRHGLYSADNKRLVVGRSGAVYALDAENRLLKAIPSFPPVRTEHAEVPGFSVFPNPATDRIHIDGLLPDADVVLRDLLGRVAHRQRVRSGRATLDVLALARGLYLLEVVSGPARRVRAVVVR